MQTVWKGSISFGLVSIPVRLYAATEERDIAFRQVHEVDGGRVRYKRICEDGGHEVAYAEVAKGYELPDGDLVVLTDQDLRDLPVASARVVDVLTFVPMSEIDPTGLSRAYYAEPSGDTKPYVLLRDALEKAGRVAVVKIALRQRERLAILRPRDGVLVVQTMLWPDEIRTPDFRFLDEDVALRPQEVAMAESYIDAMAGDYEPREYVDDYRLALEEVVQAKIAGREVVRPAAQAADDGTVVDLMEALRRSVAEAKRARTADAGADAGAADEPPGETTAGDDGTAVAKPAAKVAAKPAAKKPAAKKAAPKAAPKSAAKSAKPVNKAAPARRRTA